MYLFSILGCISACDKTFELFTSQDQQKPQGHVLCTSVLLILTPLSTNQGSLEECDKTAPGTAIYNSAKQALNSKKLAGSKGKPMEILPPRKTFPNQLRLLS